MKGKEVRKLLGCSRSSLSQYKSRGRIRATRLDNGHFDYSEEDTRKIMAERIPFDIGLAHRLVDALGYDLGLLRSEGRTRILADRRRIVAALLHRKRYSTPDIGRFLHREPSSVNAMLRTSHLVERQIQECEKIWQDILHDS